MKKKVVAVSLLATMLVGMLSGCGGKKKESYTFSDDGKVLNIYAWNEEFKGFFEKYYEVPEGITVNWIINPSDGGVYQDKLDAALDRQDKASADDKVDLFLAEADYITKYVDDSCTLNIEEIGVTDFSTMYNYTVQAATSEDGVHKGVSFQCCPSALIYRRSIAQDVLGVSDPDAVQAKLDSWDKFMAVAEQAKAKGYYMTASFAETFRTFSNNCTSPWVDSKKNLQIDSAIQAWIDQTDIFIDKGYTLTAGIWDQEKQDQMYKSGKTMCFFGPAWYFNFCMNNAQDPVAGCSGDWAIVQGPQAHFWGGTWLLAANGTDNASLVADIMNTFTNNQDVMSKLVSEDGQFPNNTKVVEKFANDPTYGSAFLGGQNDIALFATMTGNIKWENHTIYDQLLNEGLQTALQDYYKGTIDKETAMQNFYTYVGETYPAIKLP